VSDEQSPLGHVRLRWHDSDRELDLRVHDEGVDDDGCQLYAVRVSRDVARSIFAGAAAVTVDVLPGRTALQVQVVDETDGVLT
jgi:hypothetical protein